MAVHGPSWPYTGPHGRTQAPMAVHWLHEAVHWLHEAVHWLQESAHWLQESVHWPQGPYTGLNSLKQ